MNSKPSKSGMVARRFVSLPVSAVTAQTEDAVVVEFDVGGQSAFHFSPGQYINIKTRINGKEVRRSYSLCEPAGGACRVLVKRVKNGVFSAYAHQQLRAGELLAVMPPMGNFAAGIIYSADTQVCGIAAGSGITPIISVIESVLAAGGKATLIYGNRRQDSIIFRERLAALKNLHLTRFAVYHILSQDKMDNPLFHGRLDKKRLTRVLALCGNMNNYQHILLCGPNAMMDAAQELLQQLPAKIHRELFNAPVAANHAETPSIIGDKTDVMAYVRMDGIRHQIAMSHNETILQAAHRVGLETPYACAGGVCGTCRSQLTAGEITMEVNYAVEKEERAQGIILSCQARPVSKEIELNFDI